MKGQVDHIMSRREIVIPLALCLFLGLSYLLFSGFHAGDDAYVYLQYVKHIVSGDGISFNAGRESYGFTSPLWLTLISVGSLLGADSETFIVVLGLASSCLVLLVGWWAGSQYRRESSAGTLFPTIAILLLAVEPNLLKHAYLGMEAPLGAALLLLGITLHLKERSLREGVPWSGIAMGLLVLTRPESLAVLLLILIDRFAHRQPFKQTILWLTLIALVVLPWTILSLIHFGTVLPWTAAAKGADPFTLAKFWSNVRDAAILLFPAYVVVGIVYIMSVVRGLAAQGAERRTYLNDNWLVLAIPCALVCVYVVSLSNELVYSRYFLLFAPLLILHGVRFLFVGKPVMGPTSTPVIVILILVQQLALAIFTGRNVEATYTKEQNAWRQIVEWVDECSSPSSTIVCDAIGKIGYETDRRIVCPLGIINPEILPYRRSGRVDDYYETVRPDYVVVRGSSERDVGPALSGRRKTVVFSVPFEGAILMREFLVGGTKRQMRYYNVVQVEW